MTTRDMFRDWGAVRTAPSSPIFHGGKADVVLDRLRHDGLAPNTEALFTQSNARVLLGHAANGMLRFAAMPTQVYPAPTGTGEFGLGVGMYHHFDAVMYAGDLCYGLELEGVDRTIWLSSSADPETGVDCRTTYAVDFLPRTTAAVGDLAVTLVSVAPVAPDGATAALAPAPLPGPPGVLYVLSLHNVGETAVNGKVVLQAGDLLIGHYEDAREPRRSPDVHVRQHTLILTAPFGAAGVHLHNGSWRRSAPPFEAEVGFELQPGETQAFETHVAIGSCHGDIMPTIYGLHMRSALAWLASTAAFWSDRLGDLRVGIAGADAEAQYSRDLYVRCLLDNFNCLQTDADGKLLAHWQGAPSHGYGTVWGIDVEPTAVSIVHLCPELAWAALRFFMHRSRVPRGTADHSVPILVAPIVMARQWLQITGDLQKLRDSPDVRDALTSIVADLMALKHPDEALFPSKYSSDGAVGRRYDYGTNVKVWYAFDSMALLARLLGDEHVAADYDQLACAIREAIGRTMIAAGPFGRQISGGTNLGEDPGTFYLPEETLYYDGEDTASMLAPVYGITDLDDEAWVAYHRFARSVWCPNFDPEFGALRWSPRGFAGGALDGTGYFSRLGGSVTPAEMIEALRRMWHTVTDAVTGSIFWWPHGLEYKRSLTRCSQGQGAWAWQYLVQWLGITVDTPEKVISIAPQGLLTRAEWQGFRAGPYAFDVAWHDEGETASVSVTNTNGEAWTVRVGFRSPGAGATGSLTWQTQLLAPGATATLHRAEIAPVNPVSLDEAGMVAMESDAWGEDGVLVKRFGPAHLWGHWELAKLWMPEAMPLTIRILIENGTEADWETVRVRLVCPNGWQAEGRQPQHWTRPADWQDTAALCLGAVSSRTHVVAPFWVRWPEDLKLNLSWHESSEVPFHTTTQPGPGLTLYASNLGAPLVVTFEALVRIEVAAGRPIERVLEVPVHVLPD